MDEEEMEKCKQWLKTKWTQSPKCPICASDSWGMDQARGNLPAMEGIEIKFGKGFPVVMITCQACGFTYLFNTLIMGIFEK